MNKIKCIVCGKFFEVYPYRVKTARTCSVKCRRISIRKKKVVLRCNECGKTFRVPPSRNKNNKRKFCSTMCTNKGATGVKSSRYKNGETNHSAGYRTYSCGENKGKLMHRVIWEKNFGPIPEGLLVHHKNEIKDDNHLENLGLISRGDHMMLHKIGVETRFKKGWKYKIAKF